MYACARYISRATYRQWQVHECTPANESKTARKRRLDRNRQATHYAAVRSSTKRAKPTVLDWERTIVETIDKEHPESSFDMEALDDVILMSHRSRLQDRREAAAMLRDCDGDAEARIAAAVHLMVGPERWNRWTPTAKERMACELCGRRYAVRTNGRVRKHRCNVELREEE